MNFNIQVSQSSLDSLESVEYEPELDTAIDQEKLVSSAKSLFEKLTQMSSWLFDFDTSIRDEIEEEKAELEFFERVNEKFKSVLTQKEQEQGTFVIHHSSDESETGYLPKGNLLTSIENSRDFSSGSMILQISRRTISLESLDSVKPASPRNDLAALENLCSKKFNSRRIRLDCRRPAQPENKMLSKLHYLAESQVIKRLNFSDRPRGTVPRTPRKCYQQKQTTFSTRDAHGLSILQTPTKKALKSNISTIDRVAMKTVRKILRLETPSHSVGNGSDPNPSRAQVPYITQTQAPTQRKLVVPPLGRLFHLDTGKTSDRQNPSTIFEARLQINKRPRLPAIYTDQDQTPKPDYQGKQAYPTNKAALKTLATQNSAIGNIASHETLLQYQKPQLKSFIACHRNSGQKAAPSPPTSPKHNNNNAGRPVEKSRPHAAPTISTPQQPAPVLSPVQAPTPSHPAADRSTRATHEATRRPTSTNEQQPTLGLVTTHLNPNTPAVDASVVCPPDTRHSAVPRVSVASPELSHISLHSFVSAGRCTKRASPNSGDRSCRGRHLRLSARACVCVGPLPPAASGLRPPGRPGQFVRSGGLPTRAPGRCLYSRDQRCARDPCTPGRRFLRDVLHTDR